MLGRLPEFPHVCGPDRDSPLDVDAAAAAIDDLQTGLALEDAAQGFKAVAAETAARAVRSMAASLGVDAAQHGLVAFGGAGPGHACAIAEALGIKTVIIPRLAGVFSAVGIGRSSRRAEQVAIVHTSIRDALDQALRALPFDGEVTARIAARHRGTSHVLEIDLVDGAASDDTALSPDQRAAFDAAHADRFGFARPDQSVEALEVRVSVEAQPPCTVGIRLTLTTRDNHPSLVRDVAICPVARHDPSGWSPGPRHLDRRRMHGHRRSGMAGDGR